MCKYILITAAKNEERFIERTIQSVISQTVLPEKWIIVINNSMDGTENIVKKYARKYNFIEAKSISTNELSGYSAKSHAINYGLTLLNGTNYEFLGILDADVTFAESYYETIINRCIKNPKIGIAGGDLSDYYNNKIYPNMKSPNYVRGAIQFFRKECFQTIGNFSPIELGGEDTVAEIIARMNGWQVKTFYDLVLLHHRRPGIGVSKLIPSLFHRGILEYKFGCHPLFAIVKSLRRIFSNPVFLDCFLRISGYCWACLKKENKILTSEMITFIRNEQLTRIINHFFKNPLKVIINILKRLLKISISLLYFIFFVAPAFLFSFILKEQLKYIVIYYHGIPNDKRKSFARQMKIISKLTNPISVEGFNNIKKRFSNVLITFDDGFQNILDNAIPEMLKRMIPSVIFIPTSYIGKEPAWNDIPEEQKDNKILTEAQIRSLNNDLILFGSHANTHSNLVSIPMGDVKKELLNSKNSLEKLVNKKITLFSFPYGCYNEDIIKIALECGYTKLFTIEPQTINNFSDATLIGRVSISPDDWYPEFILKIVGAYNCFRTISRIKNLLKILSKKSTDKRLNPLYFHRI